MTLETPGFVIPDRMLPDGTYTFKEHETVNGLVEALRQYDPRLSLCINGVENRWELWRMCEDAKARRIASFPKERGVPPKEPLLAQLRAYDTHMGYDPVADLIAEEAANERRRERDFADELDDVGDKLHHALSHDLSAHAPAARPIPLSGRPT